MKFGVVGFSAVFVGFVFVVCLGCFVCLSWVYWRLVCWFSDW